MTRCFVVLLCELLCGFGDLGDGERGVLALAEEWGEGAVGGGEDVVGGGEGEEGGAGGELRVELDLVVGGLDAGEF